MKKKQPTFAERAKLIKAKYTRADFDKIERKDMMKELSKLRDEQEETRAAMGIADGADQQDQQEQEGQEQAMGSYYDGLNDSQYLPKTYNTGESAINFKADNPYNTTNQVNLNPDNNVFSPMQSSGSGNQFQSPQTSIWPSAISAASSVIGDVAGLINYNRVVPKSISLPRLAPTKVNLQPQREGLQRGYNTASNVMLSNSRNVSNPTNAYANQIAGISALTDSVGNQMGQSYMNEANTNAQLALQTGNRNTELATRETGMNLDLKQNRAQVQGQYINSLSQTIPMALRDYRQQNADTNMVDMSGKDYGLYSKYNSNMTFAEKMRLGILGPHYDIRNRNYANQNLRNH